jgi:hypothetical protein
MLKEESTSLIPCVLGESEIRQRGQELATALEEFEFLKQEKKRVARDVKDKSDFCFENILRLREIVKTGVEAIEQPCEKVFDFENSQVYWLYEKKKYHTREMRQDEHGRRYGSIVEKDDDAM